MKKIITFLIFAGFLIFIGCEVKQPPAPQLNITKSQLALSKIVYVGNSLTAGFQSAGLVKDFQMHSYPYQIARQMGGADDFEQPLIDDPGISSTPGVGVLDFDPSTGAIVPRGTYTNPFALLLNVNLPRPYDNLGVPGATLNDVLNTTDASGGNPFFDIVLRNPNFANMTQLEQAVALLPTLVVLWIGNNDVLGAALAGGDTTQITNPTAFQSDYAAVLTELAKIRGGNVGIVIANIPNVTDIPHVNLLDGLIYKPIPVLGITDPVPVVFDTSFTPVLFDTALGLYLPLLADEGILAGGSPIEHILLPFLSEYQANGLGVPDSATIDFVLRNPPLNLPPPVAAAYAHQLDSAMVANGLNPSGNPIPGSLTINEDERMALEDAVAGLNLIISGIATTQGIPMVDMNTLLSDLNTSGVDGYSGKFVFFDPINTAFSLDGVHPNNGGYAIVANAFIDKINQVLGLQIPNIATAQYKGQYVGKPVGKISKEAANLVKPIFVRRR